ncbi:MAG: hypothetical protein KJO21_03540 [Verrucomicrobiae bacterium]|nr:hypothetical protein [Verrucomicrobiae bacterium]NNJ42572.1 hypothetical protein [Akkermansiaceae bacterium]
MNPKLILTAAKAAYENREVAAKLLTKIKDWKESPTEASGVDENEVTPDQRIALLENDAKRKSQLYKEQSELIAGLAENVAALSLSTQSLITRTKFLTVMASVSLVLSVTACIAAFR